MATTKVSKTGIGAHEKTLAAETVDAVEFARDLTQVEVLNIDGAASLYFTVDGSDPMVGGDCYFLPPLVCARTVSAPSYQPTTVKLISAGTPTYSVARVSE